MDGAGWSRPHGLPVRVRAVGHITKPGRLPGASPEAPRLVLARGLFHPAAEQAPDLGDDGALGIEIGEWNADFAD